MVCAALVLQHFQTVQLRSKSQTPTPNLQGNLKFQWRKNDPSFWLLRVGFSLGFGAWNLKPLLLNTKRLVSILQKIVALPREKPEGRGQ
jgi:hypothetical protein